MKIYYDKDANLSQRMPDAREQLQRSTLFRDALQSRINGLTTDFVARDDPYQRSQVARQRQEALAELDRVNREIESATTLVASIEHNIPTPDLVVYLQSGVPRLMGNIRHRGRAYEANMPETYIRDLNEAYNYFFFRYKSTPLLIVNSVELDFVEDEWQYEELVREIFRPNRAGVAYYNPMKNG